MSALPEQAPADIGEQRLSPAILEVLPGRDESTGEKCSSRRCSSACWRRMRPLDFRFLHSIFCPSIWRSALPPLRDKTYYERSVELRRPFHQRLGRDGRAVHGGAVTATAVCFEASSRRLGSLSVNVLRLAVAAVLFSALSLLRTHHFLSVPCPRRRGSTWAFPDSSGFVVGDVPLFQAS